MKAVFNRLSPIIAVVLLAVFVLAACDSPEPRVAPVYTYSPGAEFSTNFNYPDRPNTQVKCSVVFEVIDETAALEDLEPQNFRIRNSVLSVLGELTLEEVTYEKNLDDIATRIVERVNGDLKTNGDIKLIVSAYFTEFSVG